MIGKRVLIVEDEALIAFDLQDTLSKCGYAVGDLATDFACAMRMASLEEFDIALLDVTLGGVMVWPVAELLISRGCRVIFLSGHVGDVFPPLFRSAPRLIKPVDYEVLQAMMAKSLGG